ncbi:hypothetical protein SLA2020_333670 [Shorea laevis]
MNHGLEVFDFKEEDELPESAADKLLSKFKNPNVDDSAVLKCEFIVAQSSAVQRMEINDVPCVDDDKIDCDNNCVQRHCVPQSAGEDDFASKEGGSGLHVFSLSKPTSYEQHADFDKDNYESRGSFPKLELRDSFADAPLPWRSKLICDPTDSPSSYESADAPSDANESMRESSSSGPASDVAEDDVSLHCNMSNHCFGNVVLADVNNTVSIFPDYVLYHDNYWTGLEVIFSHGGIKIEGSSAGDNGETFSFERGIDDIVAIECQWSQRMECVVAKLQILSKDVVEGENSSGTSGIQEVKFSVFEPNWSEKQEAITSLNIRFMAIWDIVLDLEAGLDEHDLLRHKHYFPNFEEPFEEVIYPKGDSDAVSISKRDVDLLQPETFVNDTIIDFYINYLKNQIPPEDRQRLHFFNSFFFRKLADLDKDPSSISDGRAAFLRVHKWTRKVDIFGKDYIFIPVNFNLHWSLIVICHPGEVAGIKDEDLEKSPNVPCILHMDSIRGSHAGLKSLVQSYLWEEWKGRHKETSEDISSRFLNLRFVSLELPQQENSFDCGLFLLHYLELFLAEAPTNFSPFKITKFSNFLNVDWFPPTEASLKRTLIQRLIFELLETRREEITSSECSDEQRSSKFQEKNDTETGVRLLSERCSREIACHGNSPNSQADHRIEMTLLETSSMRNLHCDNDSGMVLREFFEPGAASGAASGALLGQYQSFDQQSSYYHLNGAMSSEEQDVEADAEFVYIASRENNFQQLSGTAEQGCAVPYSSRSLMMDTSWNLGNSVHGGYDIYTSTGTSCASEEEDDDDDDDVGIIENRPRGELALSERDNVDWQRSPSVENVECRTEVVASAAGEVVEIGGTEAYVDAERMQNGNEENGDLPPCEENPTLLLQQDPSRAVNQLGPDSEMVILTCCTEASEDADVIQNGNEKDKDLTPSEQGQGLPPSEQSQSLPPSEQSQGLPPSEQSQDLPPSEQSQGLPPSEQSQGLPPSEQSQDRPPSEQSPTGLLQEDPGMTVNQLDQDSDLVENKEAKCDDDTQMLEDGLLAKPDVQLPIKRTQLMSLHEEEVESQNPGMTVNQLDQDSEMLENKEASCNDTQMIADGLLAKPDEQPPAKKIRLLSPDEGKVDSNET